MKTIKILFLILFFNLYVFANVKIYAPKTFTKGESLVFSFEVVGEDIKFPKIEKIDNYIVENLGSSRSIQVINGDYSEKITRRYRLFPKKDITLPSFTFEVSGKEFKTEEIEIKSKKLSKTISPYFDLTLIPSKKELYVGDSLILKLLFKYKKGLQITDLGFDKPHFDGFWYKRLNNTSKQYEENAYIIQELDFLLFPQRSGELKIEPLKVDVQMLDTSRSNNSFSFFSNSTKHLKVYSNEMSLKVNDLPNGLNLIGEFNVKASIDKNEINQGKSISYKLEIDGYGNFDDIGDLKLDLQDVTIYENKPEVNTSFRENKNEGTYSKVFSVVPQNSIVIPSFELKYFNINTKQIETKKTKSFEIKVNNVKKQEVVLQKQVPISKEKIKEIIVKKDTSVEDKIIYFILGSIFTLLIIGLSWYVINLKSKDKEEKPLEKQVKSSKTKEELLKVLIPYVKKNKELDILIFKLEKEKEIKIIKKQIIELLKTISI